MGARAQAPAWPAPLIMPTGWAAVQAIASDAAGNFYLAGCFNYSVTFGSIQLTTTNRGRDGFIAKWNPISGFQWARQLAGTGDVGINHLAVSGNNVYAAGNFFCPAVTISGTTLTNADPTGNSADFYVAKLTDAGTLTWAQRGGGSSYDACTSMAVSGNNIYLTGIFFNYSAFGSISLTSPTNSPDGFLARLTDDGATSRFQWALPIGGTRMDNATGVTVDGSNIYVVGGFDSPTLSIGGLTMSNTSTSQLSDIFVAKYIDTGVNALVAWAQQIGGPGHEGASRLLLSGGNLYLAGAFAGPTLRIGTTTLTNASVPPTPGLLYYDVFVTKLRETDGDIQWAQRAGGADSEDLDGLATNGSQVFVSGAFRATADFGSTTLTSRGWRDAYVTCLNDNGATASFAWTKQAGGDNEDRAYALHYRQGQLYVGGMLFSSTSTFDNQAVSSSGAFLATLPATPLASVGRRASGQLSVFPNPAHARVILRPGPDAPRQGLRLTLLDATGRVVLNRPYLPTGSAPTVELGPQPAGLYLLRLDGPDGYLATQRLLLE